MRKFFCKNPLCARKIFTERLPAFVEPWAQTTLRLKEAIAALGFATSGRLGARLGARLGITTSWMTILRGVMAFQGAGPHPVTALGIDDLRVQARTQIRHDSGRFEHTPGDRPAA